MLDTTELFNGWIGEEVIARVLSLGGPPVEPEGAGPIAYPLGVGTNGGVLKGFDERGIVVDSRKAFSNLQPCEVEV
jgi:hypothetical protein